MKRIPLKLSINQSKLLIPDREQEKPQECRTSFSGTRCRSAWCRARRHLCIRGAHGCLHGNHQQHHQQHRRQCFLLRCYSSWCCQTHEVHLWTTKIWTALCSKYGDQWFSPSIVSQSEYFSPNLPFVSRRRYIEKTKLKGIRYKIVEFNPMVLVGKVKPDSSRPDLLHPVSAASVPSAKPSTEFLSQRNKKLCFAAQLCAVLPPSARHPPLEGYILRWWHHRAGYACLQSV